jgi:hypothetical protein
MAHSPVFFCSFVVDEFDALAALADTTHGKA